MENSSRDGNTRPPYLPSDYLYAGQKQQLELDMEQQTGPKSGKKYVKAVYCHPAYLTYAEYIMQHVWLNESQAGIKIPGRNINNSDMQTPQIWQKVRETKEPLDESKRGE